MPTVLKVTFTEAAPLPWVLVTTPSGMVMLTLEPRPGTLTLMVRMLLEPYTAALVSEPPVTSILPMSSVAKNTGLSYFTVTVTLPCFTLPEPASGVEATN